MKSVFPLVLQGDRAFILLGTGHHVKYFWGKQVQQRKETYLDLSLSSSGRSSRPVVEIHKSNDTTSLVLDPIEDLNGEVGTFHVEKCSGLGDEAGHVVVDRVRCLRNYTSGITRFPRSLYRCSITKMVDYSICVVAVEPRLACLNRYPSCSAESTSFVIQGSTWCRSKLYCNLQ